MEFSVKTSEILPKLELAAGVAGGKSTIPILANVLIEASDGCAEIAATDLELSIETRCPAKVKKEGRATVSTAKLLNLIRLLPEGEVRFKLFDNHWVQLSCDRKTYKLVGILAENFPSLPAMPIKGGQKISAAEFCNLADKVSFAISDEESRYTTNGALLRLNGALSLVATDGHRLALANSQATAQSEKEERALVPKKALALVVSAAKKLADGAELLYASEDKYLFFQSDEWLIIARQLDGKFPNYEAVLPGEPSISVSADREELKAALKRVGQMSDRMSRAIKLTIGEGGIELAASSPESGEAKEAIPAVGKGEMIIGFNGNYLLDFLAHCPTERVSIGLRAADSAGDFRPVGEYGYRYVVMPMRI